MDRQSRGGGRDELESRLNELVGLAANGHATSVVLEGPAGIGKTWLLDRLAATERDRCLVLACRGHRVERTLPFAGLHQLLDPVVEQLDQLPAPRRDALTTALALRDAAPGERFAVAAGLHLLLTRLAESRPVLVLVDDTHWLDASTFEALIFATRRFDADRICVVWAARPGIDDLREAGFTLLRVDPLTSASARQVLAEAYPELAAPVARAVLELAAGLPLALVEVPAELPPEQRTGREPLDRRLPTGPTLERFYAQRLADLDETTSLALLVASLDDLDGPHLAAALACLDLTIDAFSGAESNGLITMHTGRVEFGHPTVCSAIVAAASGSDRVAAHRAVAAALADDPERQVWHLDAVATGTDDALAVMLAQVAAAAAERGAFTEAGRAFESAASRAADLAFRRACLADAADNHRRCGAHGPLIRVLGELVEDAPDREERVRWNNELLSAEIWTDPTMFEPTPLLREAQAVSGHAPIPAAKLMTTVGLRSAIGGRPDDAATIVDQAREIAPILGDENLELALSWDVIDTVLGRPAAGTILCSDRVDGLSDEEVGELSPLLAVLVVQTLSWLDEIDRADELLRRQRVVYESVGALGQVGMCMALQATVAMQRGDWARARSGFTAGASLCADTGASSPIPLIEVQHAFLLSGTGDAPACRDLVERATRAAGDLSGIDLVARCALGRLELTNGRPDAAIAHLSDTVRPRSSLGPFEPRHAARIGDLVEALLRLRRTDEAAAELERYEASVGTVRRARLLAIAERCHALLGPEEDLDRRFASALSLHDEVIDVYERARTELAFGQSLRRARRKRDARPHLRSAHDDFHRLGAHPWAAVARGELAACGERRPVTEGPASELTPRELEVATAVARGATNAEAAASLYVSARTIEYHLSSVYRKLRVRSRSELADVLGLDP